MTSYVHAPIRSPEDLGRVVEDRRAEGESIDFKGDLPLAGSGDLQRRRFAFACRLAAFANQAGGDIVIGVREEEERAAGWLAWCEDGASARIARETLDWLGSLLRPRDYVEALEVLPVRTPAGAECEEALVISIPPSALPVAVCDEADRRKLCFPVRVGAKTHYLEFGDVMDRMRTARRSMRFTMMRVVEPKEQPLHFGILPRAMFKGTSHDCPPAAHPHAKLLSLTADAIEVAMTGWTFRAVWGEPIPAGGSAHREGDITVPDGGLVTIPYDLIRAAWRDSDGCVAVALDGVLIHYDDRWRLYVGATDFMAAY